MIHSERANLRDQQTPLGELMRKARTYARTVLGRQPAGRAATAYPDDTYIVSYPRSGNTWTRFLIGNLVYPGEPMTFLKIESLIPDIYVHTDRWLRRLARPRILRCHECFDPRYKRVIYILRDPRDVAVSTYHYHIKKLKASEAEPVESYVPRWLNCAVNDFWPPLGNWGENVLSWLAVREPHRGFLLLRYEDMKNDTQGELDKVARFLGLDASPERLSRAVELSSTDRMRRLEREEHEKWVGTRGSRIDRDFVRKGVAGEWKSALPKSSVTEIESAFGNIMRRLGYKLSSEKPSLVSAATASAFLPGIG